MLATGNGRLTLRIEIPLLDPERFKVGGEYQIVNNELRVDADAPPFSQVNGRLEFTESTISARAVTSQFLGGPTTISLATRAGARGERSGTNEMSQIPRDWGEGRSATYRALPAGTLTLAGKSCYCALCSRSSSASHRSARSVARRLTRCRSRSSA
jgi:uncharacterized protein YhdP